MPSALAVVVVVCAILASGCSAGLLNPKPSHGGYAAPSQCILGYPYAGKGLLNDEVALALAGLQGMLMTNGASAMPVWLVNDNVFSLGNMYKPSQCDHLYIVGHDFDPAKLRAIVGDDKFVNLHVVTCACDPDAFKVQLKGDEKLGFCTGAVLGSLRIAPPEGAMNLAMTEDSGVPKFLVYPRNKAVYKVSNGVDTKRKEALKTIKGLGKLIDANGKVELDPVLQAGKDALKGQWKAFGDALVADAKEKTVPVVAVDFGPMRFSMKDLQNGQSLS